MSVPVSAGTLRAWNASCAARRAASEKGFFRAAAISAASRPPNASGSWPARTQRKYAAVFRGSCRGAVQAIPRPVLSGCVWCHYSVLIRARWALTRDLDIETGAAKLAAEHASRSEPAAVIERWYGQLVFRRDMLWSPTIRAPLLRSL
jgi:hypothetical protein